MLSHVRVPVPRRIASVYLNLRRRTYLIPPNRMFPSSVSPACLDPVEGVRMGASAHVPTWTPPHLGPRNQAYLIFLVPPRPEPLLPVLSSDFSQACQYVRRLKSGTEPAMPPVVTSRRYDRVAVARKVRLILSSQLCLRISDPGSLILRCRPLSSRLIRAHVSRCH